MIAIYLNGIGCSGKRVSQLHGFKSKTCPCLLFSTIFSSLCRGNAFAIKNQPHKRALNNNSWLIVDNWQPDSVFVAFLTAVCVGLQVLPGYWFAFFSCPLPKPPFLCLHTFWSFQSQVTVGLTSLRPGA